jgi:hypothetical protein
LAAIEAFSHTGSLIGRDLPDRDMMDHGIRVVGLEYSIDEIPKVGVDHKEDIG